MGYMVACQPEQKAEHTNRHSQKFIRHCHHTSTPAHPHTHTLSLNERIIVSRQDGAAWAIAMGTVAMTNEGEVELLLDKYVIFSSSMELVSEDVHVYIPIREVLKVLAGTFVGNFL